MRFVSSAERRCVYLGSDCESQSGVLESAPYLQVRTALASAAFLNYLTRNPTSRLALISTISFITTTRGR